MLLSRLGSTLDLFNKGENMKYKKGKIRQKTFDISQIKEMIQESKADATLNNTERYYESLILKTNREMVNMSSRVRQKWPIRVRVWDEARYHGCDVDGLDVQKRAFQYYRDNGFKVERDKRIISKKKIGPCKLNDWDTEEWIQYNAKIPRGMERIGVELKIYPPEGV
jgi:hypothetical protein